MQRGEVKKQPSGTWAYRYYTGRLIDGKPERKQVGGFAKKGEASAALADTLDKLRLGKLHRPRLTGSELVDKYLAQHDAEQTTIGKLRQQLKPFLSEFGDILISDIEPSALSTYRATLPAGARHDYFRAVRQVLAQAVRWNWLDENPATAVKNPKPKRTPMFPFVDWQEVMRFSAEFDERYRAIPVFAVGTGLRPQEWLALHKTDVDRDARVVTVQRAYSGGELKSYGKTDGSFRRVPLRQMVLDALDLLPASESPLLFPGPAGGVLDLENFRRDHWLPAVGAAGIEGRRRIYDARHTYATWSLRANINLFTLARRMGTSVKQIDDTYGHLAPDAEDYERGLLDSFDVEALSQDSTVSDGVEARRLRTTIISLLSPEARAKVAA